MTQGSSIDGKKPRDNVDSLFGKQEITIENKKI